MRVILCGYGRMGRQVEQALLQRKHEVIARIDPIAEGSDYTTIEEAPLADCDVVIDFSHADGVIGTLRCCADAQRRVVIGATGWYDRLSTAQAIVEEAGIGCIVGSNFSIGVNLFYSIVQWAAALVAPFEEYDITVSETHHRKKQDSPSGTALTLARKIMEGLPRKRRVVTQLPKGRALQEEELQIASLRIGAVPGTHTIAIDGPHDGIELTHRARSRGGFADGAVLAAEWIATRTGWYETDKLLPTKEGWGDSKELMKQRMMDQIEKM